jgi:hypothetical protein
MARQRQPDNIFLTFKNVETLSGDNNLNYFYREGQIFTDGGENLLEPKQINLSQSLQSRSTRIFTRAQTVASGSGTYVTEEGVSIPYSASNEIWASHNYLGDYDVDTRDTSATSWRNSWWYDTKEHRNYKIYSVLEYTQKFNILGTEYYNWRIADAYVVYKAITADSEDGVFTFTTEPVADVIISASAYVQTPNGFSTWNRADLRLYFSGSLYATSSISAPDNTGSYVYLNTSITASAISINDQIQLSMAVQGGGSIVDPLVVTEYSMSINTPGAGGTPLSFLGLTTGLGLEDVPDCQPTLNNAVNPRLNQFVMDVDYSDGSNVSGSGILLPQNLSLLRNFTATRASIPDSNYSQFSFTNIRYSGSKTTRQSVNKFSPGDQTGNLGAIPNVELLNTYIGYFDKIVDPYPNLNKKTAFFVKYLVDENSEVFDPALTDVNLNNFKSTFKLKGFDGTPTNVRISVTNIDEAKELKNLEETLPQVFEVAEYPTPILYSQTSSIDRQTFSSGIPLIGTASFTASGPWWVVSGSERTTLECTSSILIDNYNSNVYMGSLTYNPSVNSDFPAGVEPSFTKFDPINVPWSLISQSVSTSSFTRGDEVRFENNEDYHYHITNIDYTASTSLKLSLNKAIPTGVDVNNFLFRRYVPNPSFVILDVQKPYGFPPSASSSPGILAPEYRTQRLEDNPDTIISTLIENNLI